MQGPTQADELNQLRAEKRLLLENERQLRALRDVERSNARTAHILQERRREKQLKQQAHLQQVINGSSSEWGNNAARGLGNMVVDVSRYCSMALLADSCC